MNNKQVSLPQAPLRIAAAQAQPVSGDVTANIADLTMGGYMLISPLGDHLAMVARIALTSENLCSWHGLESVHFAAGTPYETEMAYRPPAPERIMSTEVAATLRRALVGVVENGTGTRVRGVYAASELTGAIEVTGRSKVCLAASGTTNNSRILNPLSTGPSLLDRL